MTALKGVQADENHPTWKGNKVSYDGLHRWIRRKLGNPNVCEYCNKKVENRRRIHWANKSRDYKRDLDDWIALCVSCHYKYDKEGMTL